MFPAKIRKILLFLIVFVPALDTTPEHSVPESHRQGRWAARSRIASGFMPCGAVQQREDGDRGRCAAGDVVHVLRTSGRERGGFSRGGQIACTSVGFDGDVGGFAQRTWSSGTTGRARGVVWALRGGVGGREEGAPSDAGELLQVTVRLTALSFTFK
jgi:hypothetical protein